ncbi:protein RMD5 homolog [Primulina tabacum]|uniref:protein RMD5 homolog n=1 Tax=Primulina tabacum TaxID=48773 RepID=UPI003F597B64
MELNTIKDSFERIAKKQKLSCSLSKELIDQVSQEIEHTLSSIQSGKAADIHQRLILANLKAKDAVVGSNNQSDGMQRELNINITKFQKLLEKLFNPDISKACRDIDFEPGIVNQIIINHFYREGQFDIVDCLLKEAGEDEPISLKLQFQEIHEILEGIKCRNFEPALTWVAANREKLNESGSDLELKLHKLQFVDILQNQGRAGALKYARMHLGPLASRHMTELQKLMGSLLWGAKLEKSPCADLVSPVLWEELAGEIMRTFCNFAGQSFQNPLKVALAAGLEGLPKLLKLVNFMSPNTQEWQDMKQLPVAVELGEEFRFHSVFVCPVSREQASEENPPMMLPCGHVLCKQSIHKLSKGNSRGFKCPYCPLDASAAQCRQLYF